MGEGVKNTKINHLGAKIYILFIYGHTREVIYQYTMP